MQKMIRWGIIGCGDVAEVKSGPAFNLVNDSLLHAVMRRNAAKAADYAIRHQVSKWYDNAETLIHDPLVNAVYIATPPDSHEHYALMAINAGKSVYLEKPMSLDSTSSQRIAEAAKINNVKLSVAHYRRQMPLFRKVKALLDADHIGSILAINLVYFQKGNNAASESNWRLNPQVSGGGYFHDLAPHQLDLIYYFFKAPVYVRGVSLNQAHNYEADDAAACTMLFENGAVMTGLWSFSVSDNEQRDRVEIIGTEGTITFSVFDMKKIRVAKNNNEEEFIFDQLRHVQQPMIEAVTRYFSDAGSNPCSGDDGHTVMWMIDEITRKNK
jgi:predicted dehydrogenase